MQFWQKFLLCAALVIAVPFPVSQAGDNGGTDKKILKQLETIENAPVEVRKQVLIRMLQILDYEEIDIKDILLDATEAASGEILTS